MKHIAFFLGLTLAATPALANYGDVDMELETLRVSITQTAQPQTAPSTQVAVLGTCTLSFSHLVVVPRAFQEGTPVVTACLEE